MIEPRRCFWTGAALFAGVLAGVSCSREREANTQQLALGRDLYAQHCASCHGAKLEGQPNWQTALPDGRMPVPPLNAAGHAPHHPESELFRIVKEGMETVHPGKPSDMPAFSGVLSDDEIRAVLAFVESTW
jgi:mono/diheme cytochrome c family protein